MRVLIINCYHEGSTRGSRCVTALKTSIETILKDSLDRDDVSIKHSSDISDLACDWDIGRIITEKTKSCAVNFDKVDIYFIVGDGGNYNPWDQRFRPLSRLIVMAHIVEKPLFCVGFGSYMSVYTSCTNGMKYNILNNVKNSQLPYDCNSSTLCGITPPTSSLTPSDSGLLTNAWIDYSTGDLYEYEEHSSLWTPICNIGFSSINAINTHIHLGMKPMNSPRSNSLPGSALISTSTNNSPKHSSAPNTSRSLSLSFYQTPTAPINTSTIPKSQSPRKNVRTSFPVRNVPQEKGCGGCYIRKEHTHHYSIKNIKNSNLKLNLKSLNRWHINDEISEMTFNSATKSNKFAKMKNSIVDTMKEKISIIADSSGGPVILSWKNDIYLTCDLDSDNDAVQQIIKNQIKEIHKILQLRNSDHKEYCKKYSFFVFLFGERGQGNWHGPRSTSEIRHGMTDPRSTISIKSQYSDQIFQKLNMHTDYKLSNTFGEKNKNKNYETVNGNSFNGNTMISNSENHENDDIFERLNCDEYDQEYDFHFQSLTSSTLGRKPLHIILKPQKLMNNSNLDNSLLNTNKNTNKSDLNCISDDNKRRFEISSNNNSLQYSSYSRSGESSEEVVYKRLDLFLEKNKNLMVPGRQRSKSDKFFEKKTLERKYDKTGSIVNTLNRTDDNVDQYDSNTNNNDNNNLTNNNDDDNRNNNNNHRTNLDDINSEIKSNTEFKLISINQNNTENKGEQNLHTCTSSSTFVTDFFFIPDKGPVPFSVQRNQKNEKHEMNDKNDKNDGNKKDEKNEKIDKSEKIENSSVEKRKINSRNTATYLYGLKDHNLGNTRINNHKSPKYAKEVKKIKEIILMMKKDHLIDDDKKTQKNDFSLLHTDLSKFSGLEISNIRKNLILGTDIGESVCTGSRTDNFDNKKIDDETSTIKTHTVMSTFYNNKSGNSTENEFDRADKSKNGIMDEINKKTYVSRTMIQSFLPSKHPNPFPHENSDFECDQRINHLDVTNTANAHLSVKTEKLNGKIQKCDVSNNSSLLITRTNNLPQENKNTKIFPQYPCFDGLDFTDFEKDSIVAANKYFQNNLQKNIPKNNLRTEPKPNSNYYFENIDSKESMERTPVLTEIIVQQKPSNPMKMFTNYRKIQNKIAEFRGRKDILFETTYVQ